MVKFDQLKIITYVCCMKVINKKKLAELSGVSKSRFFRWLIGKKGGNVTELEKAKAVEILENDLIELKNIKV